MHNIEIRTIGGIETASYIENGRKERAWHGLGTVYDRPLTAVEALQGAHADFEVGLQPIIALDPTLTSILENGAPMIGLGEGFLQDGGKTFVDIETLRKYIIEGKKATMRLDYNETLGVVSDSYGVVQNKHAFDFVDMLTTGKLGGEIPTIECAGMLGKGERVFITAKFPEPILMGGKNTDPVDMYVVFTTSHDGTGAVTCMVTPVRVVCNNTLNWALRENSGKKTWRHTRYVLDRMDITNHDNAKMAYETLGLFNTYKTFFEDSLAELASVKLTDKDIEKILAKALLTDNVFKVYTTNGYSMNSDDISTTSKNIITNVTDALHTGIGQDSTEAGNGLWLVNGITTYFQNNYNWKNDEKKFLSITEGSVSDKVQKAVDEILKAA